MPTLFGDCSLGWGTLAVPAGRTCSFASSSQTDENHGAQRDEKEPQDDWGDSIQRKWLECRVHDKSDQDEKAQRKCNESVYRSIYIPCHKLSALLLYEPYSALNGSNDTHEHHKGANRGTGPVMAKSKT
ncbi:MAG: hypothetical protein ACRDZ8_03160 [Acidimicrobiales bacterium]